jgi:citrate synthase
VLDTRITSIDEHGPRYYGVLATELAERGTTFEAAAELLWTGTLPAGVPPWQPLEAVDKRRATPPDSIEELLVEFPALLRRAPERHARARELEIALGRKLVRSLAELLAPRRASHRGSRIAELLAPHGALPHAATAEALDLALVLIADHELNASSFAARVAASTDAHLPACLCAALATLSGPRHGGACDRVEALLEEAAALRRPVDVIERRALRGEAAPGFGHPLYPHGDPRGRVLLDRATKLARASKSAAKRLGPASTIAARMEELGMPATVDFALAALARVLGLPRGFAALLFALGRSAGWVAHVLEQRGSNAVLRPRARYVGASA